MIVITAAIGWTRWKENEIAIMERKDFSSL